MFDINEGETDQIINRFTSQLGHKPIVIVVKKIMDNIMSIIKAGYDPNFDGQLFNIQVKHTGLSESLYQFIITATYRNDIQYRNTLPPESIEEKLCGLCIHSNVMKHLMSSPTRKLLKKIEKIKGITYSDDRIIMNNCNVVIPAIIVYNLNHVTEVMAKTVMYQHILDKSCNQDNFMKHYKKYQDIDDEINRKHNKDKIIFIIVNDKHKDDPKQMQRVLNLPSKQQSIYMERKKMMDERMSRYKHMGHNSIHIRPITGLKNIPEEISQPPPSHSSYPPPPPPQSRTNTRFVKPNSYRGIAGSHNNGFVIPKHIREKREERHKRHRKTDAEVHFSEPTKVPQNHSISII